ncbi:hypothetical protein LguiA_035932 [Lonicera macranthoides]
MVAEIVDWDLRYWNLSSISHILSGPDIKAFLNLSIGDPAIEDRFIWPASKKGVPNSRIIRLRKECACCLGSYII